MLSIAITGKPNSGKSTFFRAASLARAEIASYPFTTIDANHGISYVRTRCVCTELSRECDSCVNGNRFTPVGLIDVAGLVPDAYQGRGLGNQFLDHLRRANAIIHVVDASGRTDFEGNYVENHDPLRDVDFLDKEITMWLYGILKRRWDRILRKSESERVSVEKLISEYLAGIGITESHVKTAISTLDTFRSNDELVKFAGLLRKLSKPIALAANKMDVAPDENIERLREIGANSCSAEAELALRSAAKNGLIRYLPGDPDFIITGELSDQQEKGLEVIRALLDQYGSAGVQKIINHVVFDLLDRILVYPVEDENRFCDKNGRILPDSFLMKKGASPKDLAYEIHTDIGEGFLYAVDARTRNRLGDSYELKNDDVIKIAYVD